MSDYWKKRKAQRMYEAMGEAEKTTLDIAKVYAQSTTYLNSQIEGVFNKYKKKYGLSEKEARELLNKAMDKHSFDSILEELRKGVPTNEKKELLSILESPAYRYRINRLENIQNQIDDLVVNIYNKEKDISTKHYVDTSYAGYYKSVFDIQKSTGYAFSFNALDPKAVDKLLNSKWSGENYSQRIWNNTQDLANELKDELMVSLLTGKSERDIANDLANRFNVGAYKARRLVRTESNFAYTEAEMMSYEECECDNYVFLATLDLVTSKICKSLDMKRFKLKDRQTGVNAPPMHPWCRSTTIAGIDDKALSQMKRSARDTKTGKTYKVSANQNYSQWLNNQQNKYGKDNVDVFRKKVLNLKKDQEQLNRYKKVLGNEFIPDTLDKFQDMKYNDLREWTKLKRDYIIMNNEYYLKEPLEYNIDAFNSGYIPENTIIWPVKTIAGGKTGKSIRDINRLVATYGGASESWMKKVGKIETEKYIFDVHWYSCDKKQYELKYKSGRVKDDDRDN